MSGPDSNPGPDMRTAAASPLLRPCVCGGCLAPGTLY